jgi:hypothetical protein
MERDMQAMVKEFRGVLETKGWVLEWEEAASSGGVFSPID